MGEDEFQCKEIVRFERNKNKVLRKELSDAKEANISLKHKTADIYSLREEVRYLKIDVYNCKRKNRFYINNLWRMIGELLPEGADIGAYVHTHLENVDKQNELRKRS